MKKIVFLIVDHVVDGLDKEHIIFASLDELERDRTFAVHNNKYLLKKERIVDLSEFAKQTLDSLDGLQKLSLFYKNDQYEICS